MKTQKRDLEVFVGLHPMERADSLFLEFGPIALFTGLGFLCGGLLRSSRDRLLRPSP